MKSQIAASTMLVAGLVCALASTACATTASAPAASSTRAPKRGTVNDDAMTVQDCRDRLASAKASRPKDDDPNVDLDAVCRNILDSIQPKPPAKKPAS